MGRRKQGELPKWATKFGLKPAEIIFVEGFLRTGRAGPSYQTIAPGATPKSCREAGHRWRKRLSSAIAAATEERSELLRGGLIEKLKVQAGYDIGDYINADGSPKFETLDELSEEQRLAITGIVPRVNERGVKTIEIKFADRMRAIETLSKMVGLLKPGNVNVGVAVKNNLNAPQFDPRERLLSELESMRKRMLDGASLP